MDFAIGGIAAVCACLFSNPIDVIKTRQQLQGELERNSKSKSMPYRGIFRAVKSVIKAEGIRGLQKGLAPALASQFVMNGTRLGIFQTADNLRLTRFSGADKHSPFLCVFWGSVAGAVSGAIGCPIFMVKTQIQAQSHGKYAVGYQHQHTGTVNAFATAYRAQGIRGLFKGLNGLVPRYSVGSAIQLTTFSKSKDFFLEFQFFRNSTFFTAVAASMVSGGFLSVGATPFDVVATRLLNQGVDANGKGLLYRNVFDCFAKIFKIEGMHGLYKGFFANYWRLVPHSILHLTFWDLFKKWKVMYIDHGNENLDGRIKFSN